MRRIDLVATTGSGEAFPPGPSEKVWINDSVTDCWFDDLSRRGVMVADSLVSFEEHFEVVEDPRIV